MSTELHKALIVTFAKAVCEVFKTQCSAEVAPGQVARYAPNTFEHDVGLCASIGILSPRFTGSISLGFPESTFTTIASRVLGEEIKEITEENRDFGSEMLNIIFGVMKTTFSAERGIVIQPAIPQVIQGKKLKISLRDDSSPLLIPFKSEVGPFFTTIALSAAAVQENAAK